MHLLDDLDVSQRVAKRAQYEAFEFSVTNSGVRVRNCSHAEPADHEYLVRVEGGVPVACECPADEHYAGACKHRVAVAIRTPVLEAAIEADGELASDGGRSVGGVEPGGRAEDGGGDEECEDCIGEFPCWECYRTGRKSLPN